MSRRPSGTFRIRKSQRITSVDAAFPRSWYHPAAGAVERDLDPREGQALMLGAFAHPANRHRAYEFVKANIKPIAKTFLDWAITEPALKEYGQSYGILAIPIPIALPEGYPKDPTKHLIPKNDLNWAAKNYDRILKEWSKRYDAKSEKK